uniref:Putative product n=1 Tax=Xenopsylla cheopis TaxID=163159 RepID=A0A6M2DXY4_XENCH
MEHFSCQALLKLLLINLTYADITVLVNCLPGSIIGFYSTTFSGMAILEIRGGRVWKQTFLSFNFKILLFLLFRNRTHFCKPFVSVIILKRLAPVTACYLYHHSS